MGTWASRDSSLPYPQLPVFGELIVISAGDCTYIISTVDINYLARALVP